MGESSQIAAAQRVNSPAKPSACLTILFNKSSGVLYPILLEEAKAIVMLPGATLITGSQAKENVIKQRYKHQRSCILPLMVSSSKIYAMLDVLMLCAKLNWRLLTKT